MAAKLSERQRKCFDAPLQAQELEGIKAMVREHAEGGIRDGGLTEDGFLYLHTTFIQRGRLETTWTVLRKFGYAEDLRLTGSFLLPKCVASFFLLLEEANRVTLGSRSLQTARSSLAPWDISSLLTSSRFLTRYCGFGCRDRTLLRTQ